MTTAEPDLQSEARLPRERLRQVISAIAHDMERGTIPPGEVAALRRDWFGEQRSPAFWKIVVSRLEPSNLLGPSGSADDERAWALILAAVAHAHALHASGPRLGRALGETELSEPRFVRLLRAEGERFADGLRAAVLWLASKGKRFDATDLARLTLSRGHDEWARSVRREMAIDYFRALTRQGSSAALQEE